MEQWHIDGRTIYELHQDGWKRGEPVMVNRWSASVQGNGPSGATPAELDAIAQRMVKVPALEAALTAATERAGRLQTALDAAATLAGVADEIRIDWKHGIYGAEPYERLSAALKAYDAARAALGGDTQEGTQ